MKKLILLTTLLMAHTTSSEAAPSLDSQGPYPDLTSISCEFEGGEKLEANLKKTFPEGDNIHAHYSFTSEDDSFEFHASFDSAGMAYKLRVRELPGREKAVLYSRIYWNQEVKLYNPTGGYARGYTCEIKLARSSNH